MSWTPACASVPATRCIHPTATLKRSAWQAGMREVEDAQLAAEPPIQLVPSPAAQLAAQLHPKLKFAKATESHCRSRLPQHDLERTPSHGVVHFSKASRLDSASLALDQIRILKIESFGHVERVRSYGRVGPASKLSKSNASSILKCVKM